MLLNQGMPLSIYQALVVNRIAYCLSALGGFVGDGDIGRIDSLFRKAKKYGYTRETYDFKGLLNHYNCKLFEQMRFENHCLHRLLPPPRQSDISLRDRGHTTVIPCQSFTKVFIEIPLSPG